MWMKRRVNLSERDLLCKTRKLKTRWPIFDEEEKKKYAYAIDYEATITAQLALDLQDELSREIATDLVKNVPTNKYVVTEHEGQQALFQRAVYENCKSVLNSCGSTPNWLLTSPSVVKLFSSYPDYKFYSAEKPVNHGDVYYAGHLKREGLEVFVDTEFAENKILLGYRGDWHDAGYYYLPYVPLTMAPIQLDPEGFNPIIGLMMRYGKCLERDGLGYYRVIEV
jgi:hypothetical protein